MAFLEGTVDRKERFSLLLLEPGEIYFEDYSVFYYPSGMTEDQAIQKRRCKEKLYLYLQNKEQVMAVLQEVKFRGLVFYRRKQRGRLKMCSKSILFDPTDTQYPILKFAFKDLTHLDKWVGSLTSRLDVKDRMLVLQTSQVTKMKEGNVVAPYVFQKVEEDVKFLFALTYITTDDCLPQMCQLRRASTLPAADQTMMMRAIVRSRQARVKFDTSWLETLYEKIVMETEGDRITPLVTNPGRVMLTTARLYFQPFNNVEPYPVLKVKLGDIRRVIKRRFLLRHVGLEIYSSSTICPHLYLSLKSVGDRDLLYEQITAQPGVTLEDTRTENMTLRWQNGLISNYDYLFYLNTMADRSLNDLTQYPVLPWVVADFTSSKLDLQDPRSFRDLSKPIGALNDERLQKLLDRCQDMPEPRFLYGSHYSTPGFVLFYLARVAPEYMLCLQNGRFDHPDRMFNSISDAWQNCMTSFSDFKELIPEFYSGNGSFLKVNPAINFGVRHNGRPVSAADLPPWASGPEDFIRKMRAALESEHVSSKLHLWVDLVFGCKQRGQAAMDAHNLFYYLTYEGAVDLESIEDPNQRTAMEAQIMEFGQTPKQLFTCPHPPRSVLTTGGALVTPPLNGLHRDLSLTENDVSEVPDELQSNQNGADTWRNMERLEPYLRHTLHKAAVMDVRWGPRENAVYSVSQDTLLKAYSLETQEQLRSVPVSNMAISSCVLLNDAKTAVLGCWDNNIYVYSLEYGRMLHSVYAHDDAVSCLCYQGNLLVSCSWDSFAKLWQCSSCTGSKNPLQLELQTELEHESGVKSLSLNSDSTQLATGTVDGQVYLWDLQTHYPLLQLHNHTGIVFGVAFSGDGQRFISCGEDSYLRVVDVVTGAEIFCQNTGHSLRSVAWDGTTVLAGSTQGQLLIWDLVKVTLIKTVQGHKGAVTCISVSASGKVVTGSEDTSVLCWKPKY